MASAGALRLADLPVEVLTMIFSMTSSADKVNLSQVCQRFDGVVQRREHNRSIDLQGSYHLDMNYMYTYLKDSTRCKFITSVNLTSCYWIPSAFLKKCLIRLKNLETLLVADTKLTNSDLKALLAALAKVTNLAITWNGPLDIGQRSEDLKSIYMYVPALNWDPSVEILTFLKSCKKIEAVSIVGCKLACDEDLIMAAFPNEKVSLPSLRSLLIQMYEGLSSDYPQDCAPHPIPPHRIQALAEALLDTTLTDDTYVWVSYYPRSCHEFDNDLEEETTPCLERKLKGGQDSLCVDRALYSTYNLRSEAVGLTGDSVLLSLSKLRSLAICNEIDGFDTIIPSLLEGEGRLEELNCYGNNRCNMLSLCRNLTHTSPSYVLRKLCVPPSVLWRDKCVRPNPKDFLQGLAKRLRISHIQAADPRTSLFHTLVRSCPNIEVFIMDEASRYMLPDTVPLPNNFEWDSEQLKYISNWKKLRKLTLGGIPVSSFAFLEEIGGGCPMITSLSLNCLNLTSAAVNMSGLVKALPLFSKLEDVAIRQKTAPSVLHGLRQKSLRRVFLMCREITGRAIEEFLSCCDKVVFLYIACDISKAEVRRLKDPVVGRFGHRQAFIFDVVPLEPATWPERPWEPEAKTIPGIHANDMLARCQWDLVAGPRPKETHIQCDPM